MLLGIIGISCCEREDTPLIPKDVDYDVPPATHLPVITDTYVTILTPFAALAGFNITDDGGGKLIAHGVCWSTLKYPTTIDNYIEVQSSFHKDGNFPFSGLKSSTTYYLRAFATNSIGKAYGDQVSFTTPTLVPGVIYNPDLDYGSVKDTDGNIYKTIQIGVQKWMAENLKTTKYNDGSQILNVIDNSVWVGLETGAYRWCNDEVTLKDIYGGLYNWYAVNTGKLCPTGWHVPGDEEWKQLEIALGMSRASADTSYVDFDVYGMGFRGTNQGTQLKATSGWSPWEGRGGNGTNTSGFSALPAGDTGWDGKYECEGVSTSYWCFGEPPIARTLSTDESKVSRAVYYKHVGFSVRCLKD